MKLFLVEKIFKKCPACFGSNTPEIHYYIHSVRCCVLCICIPHVGEFRSRHKKKGEKGGGVGEAIKFDVGS